MRVELSTRKFHSEFDEVVSPFYENKRMMMEVQATVKVTRMVRMRGGKLGKKLVDIKTIVKKEKNVAIVKNTANFLEKIAEMRRIPIKDAWYRVCQDGGGGSFKSVVSVIDRRVDQSRETKGEKLSGVNRLLPLVVCPGIPERHSNL